MATKKQMTETINRVDIIEDNMLKMEDHLGLLKEMITMQNKHIDSMMQLIIKNETNDNKIVHEDIVTSKDIVKSTNKRELCYARRII